MSTAPTDANALHTVAVFADLPSATLCVEALLTRHGIAPATVSLLARDAPEIVAWMSSVTGQEPALIEAQVVGALRGVGPLAGGGWASGLAAEGIEGLMYTAGFQAHDGRIFTRLVERGGVLVAVTSDARAADVLAAMHNFGGGNAAIGAWRGRV